MNLVWGNENANEEGNKLVYNALDSQIPKTIQTVFDKLHDDDWRLQKLNDDFKKGMLTQGRIQALSSYINKPWKGKTWLMIAAEANQHSMIPMLIQAGAQINQ